MGIAGLVLGILSLVFCWVPILDFILGIAGIIFSAIGIAKNKNKGCAIGGLVTAIIGVIVGIIFSVVALVATAPQVVKWTNNSRNATDVSNYDALYSGALLATVYEPALKELSDGDITITMTSLGVVIKQNGKKMSQDSKFISQMKAVLGDDFMDSMELKGSSTKDPVITVTKDGMVTRTVEPNGR